MQKHSSKTTKTAKRTLRKRNRSQVISIDFGAGHKKYLKAAWEVERLFNKSPGIPDFLTDAMMDALIAAVRIKGVTVWNVKQEFDLEGLADLFEITNGNFSLEKDRVLRAMSELLHNPETPKNLWGAVADFVCEQSNRSTDEIFHSEPVLTEILKSVPPEDRRAAVMPLGEVRNEHL